MLLTICLVHLLFGCKGTEVADQARALELPKAVSLKPGPAAPGIPFRAAWEPLQTLSSNAAFAVPWCVALPSAAKQGPCATACALRLRLPDLSTSQGPIKGPTLLRQASFEQQHILAWVQYNRPWLQHLQAQLPNVTTIVSAVLSTPPCEGRTAQRSSQHQVHCQSCLMCSNFNAAFRRPSPTSTAPHCPPLPHPLPPTATPTAPHCHTHCHPLPHPLPPTATHCPPLPNSIAAAMAHRRWASLAVQVPVDC